MDDTQLLRYSRQILLPQFGIEGQQKLLAASALIIGAGGLGSPAAMYLAAAGVGRITICDGDVVELSNLQRQIAHRTADIGLAKAFSSRQTLAALNPDIDVAAVELRLAGQALEEAVAQADVVLDCSDNFGTRFAINAACARQRKALVSGAAIRFEGQVAVYDPGHPDSPCYNCVYEDLGEEAVSCANGGVIAPITGVVGCIQALEAIKWLAGVGEPLLGRLLVVDGLTMEINSLRIKKNPACPTCAA